VSIDTFENQSKVWIKVMHEFSIQGECTGLVMIEYCPIKLIFDKTSLHSYVYWFLSEYDSFSIESVMQDMAQECANTLGVHVKVRAHLSVRPEQRLVLECSGIPEEWAIKDAS
jgi:hypothetical protein